MSGEPMRAPSPERWRRSAGGFVAGMVAFAHPVVVASILAKTWYRCRLGECEDLALGLFWLALVDVVVLYRPNVRAWMGRIGRRPWILPAVILIAFDVLVVLSLANIDTSGSNPGAARIGSVFGALLISALGVLGTAVVAIAWLISATLAGRRAGGDA